MPKIEYDVDVDKEIKRKNQYSHYVTDFLKSGHENMRIECDDSHCAQEKCNPVDSE